MQKKAVILGAGESGYGAAILAKQKGFLVFVSEQGSIAQKYKKGLEEAEIRYEEHQHSEEEIASADVVIKSPGIPNTIPMIQKLRKAGVEVIGEIEFASRYTQAKLIGITGSNGKSTTTMLTYYMLQRGGVHVGLAGNIGQSFALQVATQSFDVYVLEISSFMLDDTRDFKLDVAVLLNITPDHLDRYDNKMRHYADAKFKIIQHQTSEDVFIYCADDDEIKEGLNRHVVKGKSYPFSLVQQVDPGAYLNEKNELTIRIPQEEEFTMSIKDLALQGKHNVYNNMASGIISKVWELRNETIRESMGEFKNIPHRLEFVSRVGDVTFINDSKATNVNAVWYALESFSDPIVLIMGGVDKGNDYTMLQGLIKDRARAVVCLGKDNKRIHEAFEPFVDIMVNTENMAQAVEVAYHLAHKGDTVLLSPACASFDLFRNYEDRGDQFKKAVKEL